MFQSFVLNDYINICLDMDQLYYIHDYLKQMSQISSLEDYKKYVIEPISNSGLDLTREEIIDEE